MNKCCKKCREPAPDPLVSDMFYVCSETNCECHNTVQSVEGEMLFLCDRCGGKFLPLGRVLKWGKNYHGYTVKNLDGTIKDIPAHTEIEKALCKECSKEHYEAKAIISKVCV